MSLRKRFLGVPVRRAFYGVMSRSLEEGIPQTETLKHMRAGLSERSPLFRVSHVMLRAIQRGSSPSSGLKGFVPHDELLMIRTGEETEKPDRGYSNALSLLNMKERVRDALFSAIGGPLFTLTAFFGFFLFLSLNILPQIEVSIPRATWPPSGQLLGRFADALPMIITVVVAMIVTVVMLVTVVFPRWWSPRRRQLDGTVPFLRLSARLAGIQFLSALTGFVSAGIPVGEALGRIKRYSQPYVAGLCNDVLLSTRQGKSPAEAIGKLSCFADEDRWLFGVYGQIGDLSGAFNVITEEMAGRIITTVGRAGKTAGFFMLVLIAAGLMFFYFSMLSIVFSTQQL